MIYFAWGYQSASPGGSLLTFCCSEQELFAAETGWTEKGDASVIITLVMIFFE